MEHSIYNGKLYSAYKITEDKNAEDLIRAASSNKELYCKECGMGIRYRHGDKNRAHFSHIVRNEKCIYCIYDNMQKSISAIKYMLFEHFVKQGYNVELEVKILKNHYTDLVITLENDQRIAIEFGTDKTKDDEIKRLYEEYKKNNVQLQWIIIEKNMNIYNDSNLLRKFYLGENSSPSQLIVHSYGAKIFQYFTINIDEINKDKDYNYNKRFYIFNDLNKIILYDGVIILSGYNEYAERIRGQIKSDYQRHLQYKKLYKV